MAILKTQTAKADYYITVSRNGVLQQSFSIHTDTINNALKEAYAKLCGWQTLPPEDLDAPAGQAFMF